jgi:hypothetical protein
MLPINQGQKTVESSSCFGGCFCSNCAGVISPTKSVGNLRCSLESVVLTVHLASLYPGRKFGQYETGEYAHNLLGIPPFLIM